MTKKKPLSGDLLAECQAAHALFLKKKNELNLSQKKIADAAGISAPAVNLYFKGANALNLQFAMVLSRILEEPIEKFSERLERQRLQISNEDRSYSSRQEVDSNSRHLAMDASPRSRSALEKIAGAAESGLLSEEDMLLLEVIADRLSSRKADQSESPHQRLRKKLTTNDPFSQ